MAEETTSLSYAQSFTFPVSPSTSNFSSFSSPFIKKHNKVNNGSVIFEKNQDLNKNGSNIFSKSHSIDLSKVKPEEINFSELCPAGISRGLFWNWTRPNEVAYQPCPSSSVGLAKWVCSNVLGYPAWNKPEADLSGCVSNWIANSESRIQRFEEPVVNLAYELSELTATKILFGGDIFPVIDIINHFIYRMEDGLPIYREDRQNAFVLNILKVR